MPRIIIKARVNNAKQWEQNFRTQNALTDLQAKQKPIEFTVTRQNEVVAMFEANDAEQYRELLNSQSSRDAFQLDGVKKKDLEVFVLDKNFTPD